MKDKKITNVILVRNPSLHQAIWRDTSRHFMKISNNYIISNILTCISLFSASLNTLTIYFRSCSSLGANPAKIGCGIELVLSPSLICFFLFLLESPMPKSILGQSTSSKVLLEFFFKKTLDALSRHALPAATCVSRFERQSRKKNKK